MVDEAAIPDERAEPLRRTAPVSHKLDRLEALERQVRQLMSRLASWVESELVQAVEDRRGDLRALRMELQTTLEEQAASARAEGASVLTVAVRRLSTNQEELLDRLETVYGHASRSAEAVTALSASVEDEAARVLAFEEQVRAVVARLGESLDGRLADAATGRQGEIGHLQGEIGRLRAEVRALLDERLLPVAEQANQAIEAVAAMASSMEDRTAHTEAFEERLRAAVNRLTESVDSRFAEATKVRRSELQTVRAEVGSQVDASRDTAMLAFRVELGVALDEAVQSVAAQAGHATDAVTAMSASLESEALRAEAFEDRTRTAMAQLADSVDARVATAARDSMAELDTLRMTLDEWVTERVDVKVAEARLNVQSELAALTDELASIRADAAASSAAQAKSPAPELASLESGLEGVARQVEELDAAMAAAASAETGALAPLRSDVRQLQAQVADLSERTDSAARSAPPRKSSPVKAPRVATRARRGTKGPTGSDD